MCCMTSGSTHLSTWVSADFKQRFTDEAAREGLSAFLKRLVERALAGTESEFVVVRASIPIARDARITIRLVPEDRLLLRECAAARGMPAASYVSTLVRAHLRGLRFGVYDRLPLANADVGGVSGGTVRLPSCSYRCHARLGGDKLFLSPLQTINSPELAEIPQKRAAWKALRK